MSRLHSLAARFSILLKALRQLGPGQMVLYARYQAGLRSGWYRLLTPPRPLRPAQSTGRLAPLFALPSPAQLIGAIGETVISQAYAEADEIVNGQVRLFGSAPIALELGPAARPPLAHWTAYETHRSHWNDGRDIKFTWEPARFGWVFPLTRAYWLGQADPDRKSRNEQYAETFWQVAEEFLRANPPNLGPQWSSGQEVALRLIALAFAGQVFADARATTPSRSRWLQAAIVAHARRIPPTLVYARAQNNNHLISEAVGLYTAGICLADRPEAERWRKLGWTWLLRALEVQIAEDGTYAQHSSNYHRLMLQAALWASALAAARGQDFPQPVKIRLGAAVRWLQTLFDPESGSVANLGSNDGAFIFPLAGGAYADYRPVLQAGSLAFLGQPLLPPGPWDELSLWLISHPSLPQPFEEQSLAAWSGSRPSSGAGVRLVDVQSGSWASLRAVHYTSRPNHADQLHVELWWHGLNLARDAGTYFYNAPSPWNNSLAGTAAHNTLLVDGQEQMLRGGRFLWLDWAQAEITQTVYAADNSCERVVARHNGYRRLGIWHERSLARLGNGCWRVEDRLLPITAEKAPLDRLHAARLHWLLPDAPWSLDSSILTFETPFGPAQLAVKCSQPGNPKPASVDLSLVRAGQGLSGSASSSPTVGWFSPTYGEKIPALALIAEVVSSLPIVLLSEWRLGEEI